MSRIICDSVSFRRRACVVRVGNARDTNLMQTASLLLSQTNHHIDEPLLATLGDQST
jgi:hypothetical protein